MKAIKFGQPPKYGVVFEPTSEGIADLLSDTERAKALTRAINLAVQKHQSAPGPAKRSNGSTRLSASDQHSAAFATKLLAVTDKLRSGVVLSKAEAGWVVDALEGTESFKLPAREGRPKAKNDLIIYFFVELLREAGLKPMRNPLSGNLSGCDIMAGALELLGEAPVSYSGTKAAFLRGRQQWQVRDMD